MLISDKTKSIFIKFGLLLLFLTFFKINCIKGQPELLEYAYYGTSYGLLDEAGDLHSLFYEWDYRTEEYILEIKEIDKIGHILFEKKLNISKGYDYFPMREKLYAIINDNDYVFSVEEENPYKKYLILTSYNCTKFNKLLSSNKDLYIIDVLPSQDEKLYIAYLMDDQAYLCKMNFYGEIIWEMVLSESYWSDSRITKIVLNYENNIMYSVNRSIFVLDDMGNFITEISLDDYIENDKSIVDFIILSDKNILIFYSENKYYWTTSNLYLIKIDTNGNKIFNVSYDDEKYKIIDYSNDNLFETVEGGYVIVFRPDSFTSGYYSLKIFPNGTIEWYVNDRFFHQDDEGYYYSIGYNNVKVYRPDYPLLKLISPFGLSIGEGRYKSGSTIYFEVNPAIVEENNIRASFLEWVSYDSEGYNGANNPASLKINKNLVEIAIWDVNFYVKFNCINGMLNVSDGWFDANESLIIEANSDENYEFLGWDVTPSDEYSSNGKILKINITEPMEITVLFKENIRKLIIKSDYGITSGEGIYKTGEFVTFSITPSITKNNTRYTFQGWISYDENGYNGPSSSAQIKLVENVTQIAQWKTEYYVEILSDKGGSVKNYSGWYEHDSYLSIEATPDQGYLFDGWLDYTTNSINNENSYTIKVDKPLTIKAQFSKENTGIPGFSLFSFLIGLLIFTYTRKLSRKLFSTSS